MSKTLIEVFSALPKLGYELIDDVIAIHCPSSHRFDQDEYATIFFNRGCVASGVIAFECLEDETHLWLLLNGREIVSGLRHSMTWRFVLNFFLIKDFWDYD